MAETLLSFGVEKLWNLLVRESERLQGVDGQFNGLKSDLNMLRCFLEDADAKKHASSMVRNTVKEIKEIVYDAEDIIETFLLKEELGKTSGDTNIIRRYSCVFVKRMGLAFDMEAISKRISKVIRDMQSLGVQQVIVNEGYIQSLQERQREMRQTFSSDSESVLVGLEENVKKLVDCLVEEDSSRLVSITGMGGIGKTTLARRVFNHETVKCHFSGLAWVCISQQFTRKEVWQTILRKLRPECKVLDMTNDELQEKLYGVLETQKVLIVLDDIWREEDWDIIKPMFPRNKGWKVLLTSRNEGVALLPIYLKNCFLYLAHFPEDYAINVGDLSYYWAAEGIQRPRYYDGATTREVADGYMEELVKRNMVISERDFRTSRFETCHLHDMVREVCLLKAEEENFLQIVDASTMNSTASSQSPCKSRRIVIHSCDDTFRIKNPKLRSLLLRESMSMWMASCLSFTSLQLMRVLDLSGAKFEGGKLPSNIGKLIHLRYLSLCQAHVCILPSSMRNLKSLLYLNLDVHFMLQVYMSDFLKELRELRYLALPRNIQDETKLELGNLINLERLGNFSTKRSSVTDLHSMTKLRGLSIILDSEECTLETLSSSLAQLKHLENLNLM